MSVSITNRVPKSLTLTFSLSRAASTDNHVSETFVLFFFLVKNFNTDFFSFLIVPLYLLGRYLEISYAENANESFSCLDKNQGI